MTVDQAIAMLHKAQGKAQKNAYAALRITMNAIRRETRKRTPKDTGRLRRNWQIKRGPQGAELINTRPRAKLCLGGAAITLGAEIVRTTMAENKRQIATEFVRLNLKNGA